MINSPPKRCASNSRLKWDWSLKSPSGNHSRQAAKTAALRNTDELSMEGRRVRGEKEREGECLRAAGGRMHCKYRRRNRSKKTKVEGRSWRMVGVSIEGKKSFSARSLPVGIADQFSSGYMEV